MRGVNATRHTFSNSTRLRGSAFGIARLIWNRLEFCGITWNGLGIEHIFAIYLDTFFGYRMLASVFTLPPLLGQPTAFNIQQIVQIESN